ncbi:bacteriocin biosynthesis protein [Pseudoalteromonas aurantia]|uniref:Bacteriocin biosynthesis protein n=2 Tax=Pseudoalteromonas aurantia TaxID=43654 RepID=A0A5S3VBF4_9GAMM|nr:bacteriocin biosynthesis protein [Pseudoalteromonas aurantia]
MLKQKILTVSDKPILRFKQSYLEISKENLLKHRELVPVFDNLLLDFLILTKTPIDVLPSNIKGKFVIIEDYSTNFIISPLLTEKYAKNYIKSRLRNSPICNYLRLLEKDSIIVSNSSFNILEPKLNAILLEALKDINNQVKVINVSGQTELFTVNLKNDHTLRSHRIDLINRDANFNQDGGSRSYEPQETIDKIIPFINRCNGIINHLSQLKTNSTSIKVFQTSFFKSPYKRLKNITIEDFNQICLGKGVSEEQSMASALCEAIERKNAQYEDDPICITSTANDLKARFLLFDQLTPYSQSQYTLFADKRHTESNRKQAVLNYDHTMIHWQTCWSITNNEPVYVPTVLCFANTPFEDDKFGKWQSNGCAAGNNLEEAILQALFELIERDATAIWWYNKLERPSFDLTRLDPNYLSPLHQTLNQDHDYWVLDLTVDTGVPVMAAIGRHKQNKGLIFGFGCHLKPEMAAQRALTELCQLIPIRNQNGAPFDFDAIEPESYLFANDQAPRGNYALTETLDIKDDILAVVEQLKCLNLETLALDYTRPPIPINTAKVFVPGLCHIWPQLGNKRLYDTPVKLGWLDKPLNEQTINQQGLYI